MDPARTSPKFDQLLQAIRALPVADRLMIVAAVARDPASAAEQAKAPRSKQPPICWRADEPEAADSILTSGAEGRASGTTRAFLEEGTAPR